MMFYIREILQVESNTNTFLHPVLGCCIVPSLPSIYLVKIKTQQQRNPFTVVQHVLFLCHKWILCAMTTHRLQMVAVSHFVMHVMHVTHTLQTHV